MTTRTPLTRTTALAFHKKQTAHDRQRVEHAVDLHGGVEFVLVESGWRKDVAVLGANGELLMDVSPGSIYLKKARTLPGSVPYAPGTDNPDHVLRLDNHRENSEGKATPDPTGGHPQCMECFVHHADEECP